MKHITVNGNMIPADAPALDLSNRGYRYGDGLFETIKVMNGEILFSSLHFERLFQGLSVLRYEIPAHFTVEKISREIRALCSRNRCAEWARVRLSVSRGNGGLYDKDRAPRYAIECWPLEESINSLNENGLVIGIYPGAKKSCDIFSNLKSANFLLYSMAAIHAMENKLNDCLVLNTGDHIADSTIANIFLIKNDTIITPPLSEGCVSGVMRRFLLESFNPWGYHSREARISPADLEQAEEVFLTNAINGIRWVGQFRDTVYTNRRIVEIQERLARTILA